MGAFQVNLRELAAWATLLAYTSARNAQIISTLARPNRLLSASCNETELMKDTEMPIEGRL